MQRLCNTASKLRRRNVYASAIFAVGDGYEMGVIHRAQPEGLLPALVALRQLRPRSGRSDRDAIGPDQTKLPSGIACGREATQLVHAAR
jgi:hypothetical protein